MKFLVIIPTYNENANISTVLNKVLNLKSESQIDILVIDDSSPDGTANTVKEIMNSNNNVNLLQREGKLGLSSAYCTGFEWAIDKGYDYVIQMDADLSHNPKDIIKFIDKSMKYDVIIGSRYKTGVNVVNWPLRRLILSYFANIYARLFTGMNIFDLTSGFKCIKVNCLKSVNLNTIKSEGYSFQIEMNFMLSNNGYKLFEIPIIFHDRTVGQSKMSKKIIFEAIIKVPMLRVRKILGL
tara:strand:+ start:36 stop:752 length:717 start_codon:yes stop_codon:yes gene_type:complete